MFRIPVRRRMGLAILVVSLSAPIAGTTVSRAAGTLTASGLLEVAFADAARSGSVHEMQSVVVGRNWFKLSDDVSMHDGRQHITRSDGIDAHVLLLGPVAYISGNQQALVRYFGLPKPVAHRIGMRWVRIPSSDRGWYPTVAEDATLPSALNEVRPSGHLVELPARVLDGRSVVGIRGNMPNGFPGGGTDTLFLTRSAHPMLVAATFAGSGHEITSTYSHWGERVRVSAPIDWVPSNTF